MSQSKVFTVELDGRAIVSFEALNSREASELVKEEWFRNDLQTLTSKGRALWDGAATVRVRPGSEDEAAKYTQYAEQAVEPRGDLPLAFLVELDR